jgi:hypothetical protein
MNTPQVRAPHPTKTALGGAAIVGRDQVKSGPARPIIAGVTTAGAAAAEALPYVTAAAPYVGPAGADAVLLNGTIDEVQAGINGQCTW